MEIIETRRINNHQLNVVFQDAVEKKIVIFCHGFRGSSIGPNRLFVDIARELAKRNIGSLRFDQYCSGNSEGNWLHSSFNDWVITTKTIAQNYLGEGYRVALFGQSMGASTAICVAADLPQLTTFVAWVPDPNIDEYHPNGTGFAEEGGQRVQDAFWLEAHAANVPMKLGQATPSAYIVQCGQDEYVNTANRQSIISNALPQHTIDFFSEYSHSKWSYEQAQIVIKRSVDHLEKFLH